MVERGRIATGCETARWSWADTTSPTAPGLMRWYMQTHERWADLVGRRLFSQPFVTSEDPFAPWEHGIGGSTFKARYAAVLSRNPGDPPDKRTLWNAIPQELRRLGLSWPEIVQAIELAPQQCAGIITKDEVLPTAPAETAWEVPWDEENRDFIQSGRARVKYTGSRLPASTLSEKLGMIAVHYMKKKGKGARVHEEDFLTWAAQEYPEARLTDESRQEIADEVTADREAMKKSMRRK